MKLEFIRLIANCEVALGHSGLRGLKIHLVASQPTLIAKHQSAPDRGPSDVKVHVTAEVDVLPLVPCLDFSIFFPKGKRKSVLKPS
jgi:hypothetical protein